MTIYLEIRASRTLDRVVRDLRETGDGGLRKELLRGLRRATRTAIPDVEAAALVDLPKSGGLAARVASQKFGSRTSLGSTPRVRLIGQGMKELRDIDRGVVRHPVFGNRKKWSRQTKGLKAGFWTDTLERKRPDVLHEIEHVMNDVKRKIERGV